MTKKFLLTTILPITLVAGPAVATDNPAASPLRMTEITENSHPFETLYCAREPIQVRFIGNLAEVVVNDESRTLVQAISASGARYVARDDDGTIFWGKGPFATVTWSGQQLPLCAPAGAITPPYRASGNEPFWSVSYDGWSATLKRPGEPDQEREAKIIETSVSGQTLEAGAGPDSWQLEARDGLCIDSMSGMPYPQHTTLTYQSDTLQGCGGDTERLLQGVSWDITKLGEQTTDTDATAYIQFLADNKIAGKAGCNRFFGHYTLTGETLTFTDLGSTRMACSAELMAQENTLLKLLTTVNRFSFESSDAQRLLLHADGADIQAQAQTM